MLTMRSCDSSILSSVTAFLTCVCRLCFGSLFCSVDRALGPIIICQCPGHICRKAIGRETPQSLQSVTQAHSIIHGWNFTPIMAPFNWNPFLSDQKTRLWSKLDPENPKTSQSENELLQVLL